MLDINSHELLHLLGAYGYLAVLLFVAVESMGVPVPGETMLLVASVYAGATHRLEIVLVLAAASFGAILGDNLGFLLGREGGYRLLQRFGKYVRMDDRKLRLGQYLFQRHGGKVVFFGRFVPVLRIWAAFLGGAHRMSWRRFLIFNAAGGIVWATLMGMGAYALGDSLLRMGGKIGIGTGVLGVLLMLSLMVILKRHEHRLQQEADRTLAPIELIAA
jgi:membrane protein DedA with SNARE-associated domain